MKMNIIKSLACVSIIAVSIVGCGRPAGTTTDTGRDGDQTAMGTGTETGGVAGAQADDPTTTEIGTQTDRTAAETTQGTTGETDAMGDDRELVRDEPVDYRDMFDDVDNTSEHDVMSLVRMDENLSTFVELVELAGLEQSFEIADPVTLFAPTNEAFEDFPVERFEYLKMDENREELIELINAHIMPSAVPAVGFRNNQRITTGDGNEIAIDTEMQGTTVFVGGAEIVRSDVEASNGIIHVVNGVIDPTQTPVGRGVQE